jgi:hypothetical protein
MLKAEVGEKAESGKWKQFLAFQLFPGMAPQARE